MTKHVLTVLLRGVDDRVTVSADAWCSGELFGTREELAPLGCQQIDDTQTFAARLQMGSLRGQEVHVRVARYPALPSEIAKACQGDCQVSLARLYVHKGPMRFVLETASGVDQNPPARKPSFAAAVDVRVA